MLSKFSKNIASNYFLQQKLTQAAFLNSSRQVQAASLNAMMGGSEVQGMKKLHQMRMFSTSADESQEQPSANPQEDVTSGFKAIERRGLSGYQQRSDYRSQSREGRVIRKNLSFEDQLQAIAELYRNKSDLTVQDFSNNLRYLCRLFARVNSVDFRNLINQEQHKKDMQDTIKLFEKMIDVAGPFELVEFTNFANVLRYHNYENSLGLRVKGKLVSRIQKVFTSEEYQKDIEQMSFDQISKILSDMIHFSNMNFLASKLEARLDQAVTIENLTSIVRLLDSMMASESGISQMSRLVRSLEGILKKNDNVNLLSLQQTVRLLRIFSYSQEVNLQKHTIIERLVRTIDNKVEELEEQDVLNLQQAYVYVPRDVPKSSVLYNKLNSTVSEQALQNQDDVSINFLQRYLSTFFDLSETRDTLDKNVSQQLVELLEKKIEPRVERLGYQQLTPLAKILIRNPKSTVLANAVTNIVKKNTNKLSHEQIKLALVSLRKQPEQDIIELSNKIAENLFTSKKTSAQDLAELILTVDMLRNKEHFAEGQKQLLEKFRATNKFISHSDAVKLISLYTRNNVPSQQSTELAKEIMESIFGGDKIKKVSDIFLVDLLQTLQTHSGPAQKWLRTEYMNRIREAVKDLSSGQLERYIKNVLSSQEDIAIQGYKSILEFLNNQTNLAKVPILFKYNLYRKVIQEVKIKESNAVSSDKYRIEQQLHELLNKIDDKQLYPSFYFFDTLKMSAAYLNEIPYFYERSLTSFILNDKFNSQEALLTILSAQNLFFDNFDKRASDKVFEFIKTKFSYPKLMDSLRNYQDEYSLNHIVSGAHTVSIIQKYHMSELKDNQNIITDDRLKEVANFMIAKAEKAHNTFERHQSALSFIVALSNYPDHIFNFHAKNQPKKNNQNQEENVASEYQQPNVRVLINNIVSKLNFRGAFMPFLHIRGGDSPRLTRRLAVTLLASFNDAYGESFTKASANHITKIFDKYTSHGWMSVQTYNNLLNGLSEKFDDFTPFQLSSVIKSFGRVGLSQIDVFARTIDQIEELVTRDKVRTNKVRFGKEILPIFNSMAQLQCQNDDSFKKLTSDEYVKNICYGDKTFAEQAKLDFINHEEVLASILKARLDETDDRFKQLAEDLVAIINKKDYYQYSETSLELYNLLSQPNSPLKTPLVPSHAEKLKRAYENSIKNQNKNVSPLYKEAQLLQVLKALGYEDIEVKGIVDGVQVPLYSQSHNTVIIGLDSTNLNYDRETPNGEFALLERTLKALPSQPKVHVVNVFHLARIVGEDAKTKKVEYIRDEAHVPLVSTEIKLEQQGW